MPTHPLLPVVEEVVVAAGGWAASPLILCCWRRRLATVIWPPREASVSIVALSWSGTRMGE